MGDNLAIVDPHHSPSTKLTFRELQSLIQQCAAGLSELGLKQGDKARLIPIGKTKYILRVISKLQVRYLV